jgi:hypothetical protein
LGNGGFLLFINDINKCMKAKTALEAMKLEDIPNVGPSMVADFQLLGITQPKQLKGKQAITLYKKLCSVTGVRHDPCVLDTFLAVTDFMNGAPAKPWWAYTKDRKKQYPNI